MTDALFLGATGNFDRRTDLQPVALVIPGGLQVEQRDVLRRTSTFSARRPRDLESETLTTFRENSPA